MGNSPGWDKIRFHGFEGNELELLKRRWCSLSISSERPLLVEIPKGIVERQMRTQTRGDTHVVGVFDPQREPVAASVRVRDTGLGRPRRPALQGPMSKDPRSAYYLGVDAAHYGHFLLETLCRAWAWRDSDGLVAVIQAPPLKEFARAFLGYIPGLAEHVEIVPCTTQFERVLVPSPTFVVGKQALHAFKELCCQIAEQTGAARTAMTEQPLYLSRAGLGDDAKRAIADELKLEAFLEGQGFRVVRPEDLPVREQIAMVNQHKWIVAPMGSACHTRLFALRPTNLLMLVPKLNPNYVLCDGLSEGETHYAKLLSLQDGGGARRASHGPALLQLDAFKSQLREFGLIGRSAM